MCQRCLRRHGSAAIHEALSLSTRPQRLDVCSLASHCRSEQGGSEGDARDKTRSILAAQPLSVRNTPDTAEQQQRGTILETTSKVEKQFLVDGRWCFRLLDSYCIPILYVSWLPARLPRKRGSHERTNLVRTRPP